MKLLKLTAAFTMVVLITLSFAACEGTTDESCEQQDMNEILDCGAEKNVEVCCETGADCVYKYNGQDYPDTQEGLTDLADALGCTYKSDAEIVAQRELIISNLLEMKKRALQGAY